MRESWVRTRVPVGALVMSVVLAACGGGGSGSTDTGSQSSSPPGSTTPATNNAPSINGTPLSAATVGQSYDFKPSASDSNGDTLTFSISNKPDWMTFNASTGELSGTPADANVGSFAGITISVSDGKTSTALSAFAVTVSQAALGSATLNWAAPTANTDGSSLTDLSGYRLLYGRSADTLDQSITFNNPSINSTVVQNLAPGTWYFSIVTLNAQGVESQPSNVVSTTI